MPRKPKNSLPDYRHHKPTGQAVVTIQERDFYLGKHGTEASRSEYDRLIAEWLASGRTVPPTRTGESDGFTVSQLIVAYTTHSETYYRKNGKPTGEFAYIKSSMGVIRRLYGPSQANDFGPKSLKAVRQVMIDDGLSRGVINGRCGRIKRMFKWAVSEELIHASVSHGLQAVEGLKRGRSDAIDHAPVKPVPQDDIDAVITLVSPQIQAMIKLQLLTGMRPGEVRSMKTGEIDRSGDVWIYKPSDHKTDYHGIERLIYLGPKAQLIIASFLRADPTAHVFSPIDAEAERNARRRMARKTPMTPSQRNRRRKSNPKKKPKPFYDKNSYNKAIRRACEQAGIDAWNPHRLRHNAATTIRKESGLEAAQVILGHQTADVTQVYAERDQQRAVELMSKIGYGNQRKSGMK